MKKFLTTGLGAGAASVFPVLASAQDAIGMDQRINDIFAGSTGWFVNLIFMSLPGTNFPWIVLWLVVAASVFTLYFGCRCRYRGAGRYLLDDPCRDIGNGVQIHRMYVGRKISQ